MLEQNEEELMLGYLFEALDDNDSQKVEFRLGEDGGFRGRYQRITDSLLPALAVRDTELGAVMPPADLVSRTMAFLQTHTPTASNSPLSDAANRLVDDSQALTQMHSAVDPDTLKALRNAQAAATAFALGEGDDPTNSGTVADPRLQETVSGQSHETQVAKKDALKSWGPEGEPEKAPAVVRPAMSEAPEGFRRSRSRILDVVISVSMLVIAGAVLFQALAVTREHARIETCRSNLMQIGKALQQYSNLNAGLLPGIRHASDASHHVAGVYGPILLEHGFLSPQCLFCPSVPRREKCPEVPHFTDLCNVSDEAHRSRLHQTIGGDYAYNIGYTQDGLYHPVRYEGRTNYILMADVPQIAASGTTNSHNLDLSQDSVYNHGKRGLNMLYEDGHVALASSMFVVRENGSNDHLFLNDAGMAAPGISPSDIVLGRSELRFSME